MLSASQFVSIERKVIFNATKVGLFLSEASVQVYIAAFASKQNLIETRNIQILETKENCKIVVC